MRRLPRPAHWSVPKAGPAADADAGAARQMAPYLLMVLVLAFLTVLLFWGYARWFPMAGRAGRTKSAVALSQALSALRAGDQAQAQKLRAAVGRAGANTALGCYLDGLLAGVGQSPGKHVDRRLEQGLKGRGGARALVTLAGFKSARRDKAGSLEALEKAYAQRPHDRELGLLLVSALLEGRQYQRALDEVDELEANGAPEVPLAEMRGRAYLGLGDDERALAEFRSGISLAPREVGLLLAAADVLILQGDPTSALGLTDSALRVDPQSADAHYCRGIALEQLKQMDEAQAAYRKAISLRPEHSRALNNLAYLLARDPATAAEAVKLAQKAYAIAPSPAVGDTLGWAYVQAGQAAKGLPLLEAAAKALPDQAEVARHLSKARQMAAGQ